VEALARLHRHGAAIAFNTARTLDEVKEYCRAYGGVGGVAEYGAVAWDAGQDATRVLVTPESRDQLRRVAAALRRIPGVFLNDRYEHSLRAFVYQKDRSAPVPSGIVNGLLQNLGAGRLVVHQTFRDTAVLAGETDKGKGLLALVALSCREGLETIAIGDSEPDLPMFCAASRAYAPRHIGGRAVARLLGCTIAPRSYQLGLLSAVDSIVHGGGRCPECPGAPRADEPELFAGLLRAADGSRLAAIVRALADPMSWRSFVK
jgi:hydroxymethylpyrimidine pyrophosphatase-like HAD family hydrolase